MKFSVKSAFLSAVILTLAYSQGCANISYKGKSYAPTESVEVVKKQKEIPVGYELMGKAVGTAPAAEGSRQEMEKKIIQKAKSEGADAVMIILFEEVKIGEERDDQFMNVSHEDAGWGLNVDTEGNTKQINSFNTRIDKGDRLETSVYKSVIKAIFLKKIPSSQKMTE
jgi:hypothetical protein